jgi:hypothetical protein
MPLRWAPWPTDKMAVEPPVPSSRTELCLVKHPASGACPCQSPEIVARLAGWRGTPLAQGKVAPPLGAAQALNWQRSSVEQGYATCIVIVAHPLARDERWLDNRPQWGGKLDCTKRAVNGILKCSKNFPLTHSRHPGEKPMMTRRTNATGISRECARNTTGMRRECAGNRAMRRRGVAQGTPLSLIDNR